MATTTLTRLTEMGYTVEPYVSDETDPTKKEWAEKCIGYVVKGKRGEWALMRTMDRNNEHRMDGPMYVYNMGRSRNDRIRGYGWVIDR